LLLKVISADAHPEILLFTHPPKRGTSCFLSTF
jgi:hypothetical protein